MTCSLDESILPHPTYDMVNGVVYTPSKAFRFTKSRRVHFNCMLSVCHKNDADCVKDIPPRCPRSLRKRELPGDFSVEERLKNVHALMEVKNITSDEQYEEEEFVGDEKTTTPEASTNTRPLFIEDGPYALPHSCMPSNYLHWIYALLITNILSILVAVPITVRQGRGQRVCAIGWITCMSEGCGRKGVEANNLLVSGPFPDLHLVDRVVRQKFTCHTFAETSKEEKNEKKIYVLVDAGYGYEFWLGLHLHLHASLWSDMIRGSRDRVAADRDGRNAAADGSGMLRP
ncbi:hypothetical protein RB195_016054 [Necator americanus]|uniref:ZP domain-containing protein n=1 Tax=Necator americanus TaxID=51031 RepID=A0ABR1E7D6_NECAM